MIAKDRTVLVFYALSIAGRFRFSLIMPIRVVFLLSRGLSLAEVGIIESVALIASVLVGLPTGSFADNYGRKFSLTIGYLLFGLGFVIIAISDFFVWLAIGFSLAEVGESFVSNSLSAWIVDYLETKGWQEEIANVFGQSRALLLLANITGSIASGYLARRDMAFPFLVSSLFSFLNVVLVACLVEEKRRAATGQPLFFEPIKKGLKHYVQYRSLVILTFGSMLISIGVSCYFLGWQPYLQQFGAGPEILGITYAIMSIGFSLGSLGGGKFAQRYNNKSSVIVGSLIGLGVFCLLPVKSTMFIIIFLLVLWEFGFGFHEPGRYAWLNEFIPSDVRATLLSLNRLLLIGGNTLGTLLAGFAAEFNLQLAFIIGAIAFLSSVSLFRNL